MCLVGLLVTKTYDYELCLNLPGIVFFGYQLGRLFIVCFGLNFLFVARFHLAPTEAYVLTGRAWVLY